MLAMVLPFAEQPGTNSVLTTAHPRVWAATPHRSFRIIQELQLTFCQIRKLLSQRWRHATGNLKSRTDHQKFGHIFRRDESHQLTGMGNRQRL